MYIEYDGDMKTEMWVSLCCLFLGACGGSNFVTPPTAPNATAKDDTDYVQNLVTAGHTVPAGNYVLRRTIVVTGKVVGVGPETHFIFQPSPPWLQCQNDRAFTTPCDTVYNLGLQSWVPRRQIAAPIAIGATSFETVDDASDLGAGDWLIITEKDMAVGDPVVVDWVQVASTAGHSIKVTSPFRTAFPNLRTWDPLSGGLGFFKTVNVARNVSFRNFDLEVVNSDSSISVPGISAFAAQQVTVDHVNVTDTYGQALYSYLSQDVHLSNCSGDSGPVLSEFAATVDLTITACSFRSQGDAGFGLDLGTGYFSISASSSVGYGIGFYLLYGIHDGTVQGLSIPYIPATSYAVGILARGTQRVIITGNTLSGGTGQASMGLSIGGAGTLEVPVESFDNTISPNVFGAQWAIDYDPNNAP